MEGESSNRILKECSKLFKEADSLNIKDIKIQLTSNSIKPFYKNNPLKGYSCIYIRGSHKYALMQRYILESLQSDVYTPLSPVSFTIGHDKLLTLLHLQKKEIPIPTTYVATTLKYAKSIIKEITYPIIMKLTSGTQGKGVMFADSEKSAKTILDTLDVLKQPIIIQEYIETNATDVRAVVVGNEVVASMRRKAMGEEIRSNIHAGGIGEPYELSHDTEQVAIKAAKAIKAEICGVDILESRKPLVIEVNLSPGLKGIMDVTKKNIPKKIASYLFEKTKEFKKEKDKQAYTEILDELNTPKDITSKEIITNLDIKSGVIRLPPLVSKITKFNSNQEVIIKIEKGKLIIQKS